MKWVGIYFVGYTILIGGIVLALYKVGAPKRSSVEIDRN
jgi:hypothetical protein